MKILSIQVGMPKSVEYDGEVVNTGIFKAPINGPVRLGWTGLVGDGQADLKAHGGREKALYAYPQDTYAQWKALRPQDPFEFGAMGENLSMDQLLEDQIYVGDTFSLGHARVQACQPRFPCYKLAVMYQDKAILKQFMDLGRPGIYLRVLKEGDIQAGDELQLLEREKVLISIQELFDLKSLAHSTPERIREILTIPSLAETWRKKFEGWAKS